MEANGRLSSHMRLFVLLYAQNAEVFTSYNPAFNTALTRTETMCADTGLLTAPHSVLYCYLIRADVNIPLQERINDVKAVLNL